MNEKIQYDAYRDIVKAVTEWQSTCEDPNRLHRAEILRAARLLCRASETGFWVMAADVHPKGEGWFDWYPVRWVKHSDDAVAIMSQWHSANLGKKVYRVVSENEIVDARMRTE